ncbi:MAG: YkgJ family cysteine cluster protein [Verrucomicrobiae bacterium]|nr:YkgJ family cysteine cluster protein [Verrucomicrobiae bacterium]
MNTSHVESASRLCTACGMCCNGVLFQSVTLQPDDSPRELKARGIRLKSKRGKTFFDQPCPAHRNCACTIYADRPSRCRIFECQQLRDLEAGRTTESDAQKIIAQAKELTERVRSLLPAAGSTNDRRPLATRFAAALVQNNDPETDPAGSQLRGELITAMHRLESLLAASFRVAKV